MPVAMCRTGGTGRRLRLRVRAAWLRWRRRSSWKNTAIELRSLDRPLTRATDMTQLADNLARVEDDIAAACRAANRPRAEVELVAVSKTHPSSTIAEAVGLGLRVF